MKKGKKVLGILLAVGAMASCFSVSASATTLYNDKIATATTTQSEWVNFSRTNLIEYSNVTASCTHSGATAGIALFKSGSATSMPVDQDFYMGSGQRAWWQECLPNDYSLWMRAAYNGDYVVTLTGTWRNF